MQLSVILPSLWRVERMKAAVQNIIQTTATHTVQIVVVAGDHDTFDAAQAIGEPVLAHYGGATAIEACNMGLNVARYEWYFPTGDDCEMLPGWLDECEATPNQGFIGLNEGIDADFVGGYMVSWPFVARALSGVICIPHYRAWWQDQEICHHAKNAGAYVKTRTIVMRHNHPTLGRMPMDDTYRRSAQWHALDGEVFARRKAAGFPVDWKPAFLRDGANRV